MISHSVYAEIIVNTTNATGCGKSDGKATVSVSGASGNFEYSVDGGAFQTSNQFDNLSVGGHSATVRDKDTQCQFSKNFTIEEDNELQISVVCFGTTEFCNNAPPPSVTLKASSSGGSGEYTFNWPGGTLTVGVGGFYMATVTDQKTGCSKSLGSNVIFVPIVCSKDPNDIVGPEGYGPGKMVSKFESQPYVIRFENDPDFATAPAQVVKITQTLDANVNLLSFRLGDFGFGRFSFRVPENKTFYSTRLDVVDSLGVVVDVTAGIDVTKKEVFWIFESKDPATGLPPTDARLGFLPVNDSAAVGEGFVSYTVKPANSTVSGDTIYAEASIVFDINAPLATPRIFNTIDAARPASRANPVATTEAVNTVRVSWAGQDEPKGSGVRSYALYVSENEGPFANYQSGLTDTTTTFTGQAGRTYRFFTLATDNVGNQEPVKQSGEASFAVEGRTLAITGLADQSVCQNTTSGSIAFAIADGNATPAGVSTLVSSSNPLLIPNSGIVLEGTGVSRSLVLTPVTGQIGTATLTIRAITADGGSGEASFAVTVLAAPQLLVSNPPAVCAPATVDMTTTFTDPASVAGIVTYWVDAGATLPVANPRMMTESGTYYIKKTATTGACTDVEPVKVVIVPAVAVEAGADQTVSVDAPAFNLTGASPEGGIWSGPGVDPSGLFTPSTAGVGTHTLTYSVTQNGCTGTDTLKITIVSDPTTAVIASVSPAGGPAGTVVTVTGTGFTGATAVSFNGVDAASFTVVSATEIKATVPIGATTGKIRVVTPAGTATSADDFAIESRITPLITWSIPPSITYGTALSDTQLSAITDVAGTFVYDPAVGTRLNAGEHVLTVTFTPENQTDYSTATKSVVITVNRAIPVVTWSNPAPVAEGTVLSATQLNASASFDDNPVPGTFTYAPAAGTVLGAGVQTLSVDFAPDDSVNFSKVTGKTTQITVNGAPVLAAVNDTFGIVGLELTFTVAATDSDGLGHALTYSLVGERYGATIDAATGAFTWTPTSTGRFVFNVSVSDNGTPSLSDEDTVTITGLVSGLTYAYYEGNWTQLPPFETLTPLRTGNTDSLSLWPRLRLNDYAFRFTGYLDVATSGYYTFFANSDDGSRIYLGDSLLVDNDGLHGPLELSATRYLARGLHPIGVDYLQGPVSALLSVSYQGPGMSKQELPASRLYHLPLAVPLREADNPDNPTTGLNYAYFEGDWDLLPGFDTLVPTETGTVAGFDLSVKNREDYYALAYRGYVEVVEDGEYTFSTTSDDGSQLRIGSTLVVNNDGLHPWQKSSGKIGLKAGKHAIEVVYFERTVQDSLRVSYRGPGFAEREIAPTALFRSTTTRAKLAANGNQPQGQIKVYPIPTSRYLIVELTAEEVGKAELVVTDVLSKRVLTTVRSLRAGNNKLELHVGTLPAGVYFLTVVTRQGPVTRRIVVAE